MAYSHMQHEHSLGVMFLASIQVLFLLVLFLAPTKSYGKYLAAGHLTVQLC